ncbi:MAG TPA: threonine ammonia-lyase IlvA [Bacteroidia bacterium]|jgi:threonine dehydratase|nr:threonine ammonia-lyase IlvA [Bacteroidia bacterium]
MIVTENTVDIKKVLDAQLRLSGVVEKTPLNLSLNLSEELNASIYLKREDMQVVRSYKIRGAYNKIASLTEAEKKQGVVCASAGNHAQGVAYSCHKLGIQGKIFMPVTTPQQKVKQVKWFGKSSIEVVLVGDTYDDSFSEAMRYCTENNRVFVHPFDDKKVIEGQGTVGLEIIEQAGQAIDYVIVPIGGGGLAAGLGSVLSQLSPETKIIGVQPAGAPSMKRSIENGERIKLDHIEKFVDGAAVKQPGALTFEICKDVLDEIILVEEGEICSTMLKLYNENAIVVEPAGALSIAALNQIKDKIAGKKVVCIISGSNNDITRMEEIKERSLMYEGLKHYFLITFPQRAGALKEYLVNVLNPTDDITYFQYVKKNSRENGPAVVGIELFSKENYNSLIEKMNAYNIQYEEINNKVELFK